jgi:hypothetical protein
MHKQFTVMHCAALLTLAGLQVPGPSPPESVLRQILVQPLGLQQCIHFPEVAKLAAESVSMCFRDLSHQLILPSSLVLGHVLVVPCRLKQAGSTSMTEKQPNTEVATVKGSTLPAIGSGVRAMPFPACCSC